MDCCLTAPIHHLTEAISIENISQKLLSNPPGAVELITVYCTQCGKVDTTRHTVTYFRKIQSSIQSSLQFSKQNMINFDIFLVEVCSLECDWSEVIIDLNNGSVLNRRRAII